MLVDGFCRRFGWEYGSVLVLCGCCYGLGEVEALLDRVRGLIGKCSTDQSDCPAMCRVLQLLIEAAPQQSQSGRDW